MHLAYLLVEGLVPIAECFGHLNHSHRVLGFFCPREHVLFAVGPFFPSLFRFGARRFLPSSQHALTGQIFGMSR